MSSISPQEMARRIGEGLLSFPVTHFDQQYEFAEHPYRRHIAWLLEHKPAGIFTPGGTGEFFSLTLEEHSRVVAAAVSENAGRVPVLAAIVEGGINGLCLLFEERSQIVLPRLLSGFLADAAYVDGSHMFQTCLWTCFTYVNLCARVG